MRQLIAEKIALGLLYYNYQLTNFKLSSVGISFSTSLAESVSLQKLDFQVASPSTFKEALLTKRDVKSLGAAAAHWQKCTYIYFKSTVLRSFSWS